MQQAIQRLLLAVFLSILLFGDAFRIQHTLIENNSVCSINTHNSIRPGNSVMLFMGKGDGKKKRKKKKASTPPPSDAAEPAPLRVSSNSNVSVRKQIAWANMNKAYRKSQSTSYRKPKVVRTKYRRTWDEEEIIQKAEERKRRGQEPDWEVILSRNSTTPLVMVDGYNIIFKWARLKKHMTKGDTKRARDLLVDDLENLQSLKGWKIEVVFDGAGRPTLNPLGYSSSSIAMEKATKHSVSKNGVKIAYTGAYSEADAYIEKRCMEAKNVTEGALTKNFVLATDDTMIRIAGQSAGATIMSADRFVNELKAVRKGIEYRVEAAMAKVNGHSIRPQALRKTDLGTWFGRNSVEIVDKRNRTKKVKEDVVDLDLKLNLDIEEDESGIPWWATVPNGTNPYRR